MKLSLHVLSCLLCACFAIADFAAVLQDAATLDTDVNKLNDDVQATSGTSYIEALGIDSDSDTVNDDIQKLTSDGKALTEAVTDDQAQQLLDALTMTEVTTKAATDRLVELQPKFQSIGVANIAKGDITDIQASVKDLGDVVIAKAPPDYLEQAKDLIAKYNADLANAAQAYGA